MIFFTVLLITAVWCFSNLGQASIISPHRDAEEQDTVPGKLKYREGQGITQGKPEVYMIFAGLKRIFTFFDEVFGYKIFDGRGNPLHVTVNYGKDCINAFWKGSQVVIGVGTPLGLTEFYKAEDILAHELTHGIISHTNRLRKRDESGALDENLADVFGVLSQQYRRMKKRDANDISPEFWSMGRNLVPNLSRDTPNPKPAFNSTYPHTSGFIIPNYNDGNMDSFICPDMSQWSPHWRRPYLRSFQNPGSINPPQPYHMSQYRKPEYDNDGVDRNYGIPNYAFYTAAIKAGGPPWSGVGQIWFRAMVDRNLGPGCSFARFVAVTVSVAKEQMLHLVDPIVAGWAAVGIMVADK